MFAPILSLFFVSLLYFWITALLCADLRAASVDVPAWVGGSPPASVDALISRGQVRPPYLTALYNIAAVAPIRARRRRRIVIYTRYSTDGQNEQSLADQETVCRKEVERLDLGDVEISVLTDAAVSGEMANRPGIDGLWAMIESRACDVIVAEEVSRFYRHTTRAMQLVEAAVDASIRVVTVNDPIDTSNDNWRLNSHFASMKAELDNRQTRQRIRRSMLSRWEKGYAVHHTLLPGYLRVPVAEPNNPAKVRRPDYTRQPDYRARPRDPGPFIDKKDETRTPVIHKTFEMCAAGEPTWVIALHLRGSGIPRSSRAPD